MVMNKYDVLPENIYNMDQRRYAIGEVKTSKYIINAYIQ